jgi:uncharacterized protein (DUF433 family)
MQTRPRRSILKEMKLLDRMTYDPRVMGGKPCIRGLRVTVGTALALLADGASWEQILADYPYLETDDIRAALTFAAWRAAEFELPVSDDEDHRGQVPVAQAG